jgi:cell wall-associated NlpC family hydrolase
VTGARRIRWGVAIATLVTSVALTPVAADAARGHHHHAPSAAAIARSKHDVAVRAHQVKVAFAEVGRAKQALAKLNVTAEVAFEAYDGAEVKLKAAQRAVRTAHLVLSSANDQVAKGQARVTQFATAAYESGGLSNIEAYLEPGGPSKLVSRLGVIDSISSSEHTTLERLDAARIYQGVVSRQAEVVAAGAAAAATTASKAKAVAVAAVNRQTAVLHGLRHEKAHLNALLAQARSHAGKLERARIAAIARARREAAARLAAKPAPTGPSPFSGSTGSTAGTVSAATALAALHAAESQIGKPYQWGAAGPNSYDCSGLVLWAYSQVGVSLDHWTHDQWTEGAHVSQADLRPGDLVFFAFNTSDPSTIHHVGLYVGGGQMVDAPYTGVDVRYDAAFRPDYIGAVRPYQR